MLFLSYYELFLHGAFVSLQIAFCACIVGVLGGTVVALLLQNNRFFVRFITYGYVTLIRGTPMLIQVASVYYMLHACGCSIPAFWSAIISIGMNSAAYMSQIMLAGIQSVPKGQIEAAQTLGFTKAQTMRYIVLPQAFKTVFPALGNEFVTLIKDSSLASTIGVYELTKQGALIMSQTYDIVGVYMTLGCMYLCMTMLMTFFMSLLERKMGYHVKHS